MKRALTFALLLALCGQAQAQTLNCGFDAQTGTLTCAGLPTPAPPCPSCPSPSPSPSPSASPTPVPPSGTWVSGYYAGWFWNLDGDATQAVAAVDMTAMTHFIFGRYAPGGGTLGGQPGAVLEGAGNGHQFVEGPLIAKAHAAGVKALLMLGGAGDGPGFDGCTQPAVRAQFVSNILGIVAAKGYDGVDVDWEENLSTPAQQAQVISLLTELRAARPGLILTWPAFWTSINDPSAVKPWNVQVANLVDQYNLMSYGMAGNWGGWQSWHHSPLKDAAPAHPTSIESSIAAYEAAGVPAGKLGIGIGTYGIYYSRCGVTGPRQALTNPACVVNAADVENEYRTLVKDGAFTQPNGILSWDAAAQTSVVSYSPAWQRYPQTPTTLIEFLSYESEQGIAAKGAWVKAQGLGGTIVWTINYSYLGGAAGNPLMAAVKAAFLGGSLPSPSPPPPSPSPSPSPSSSPTPPPVYVPEPTIGFGVTDGGDTGVVVAVSNWAEWKAAMLRTVPRVVTCLPGTLTIQMPEELTLREEQSYLTLDMRPCNFRYIKPDDGDLSDQRGVDGLVFAQGFHDAKIMGLSGVGTSYVPGAPIPHINDSSIINFDGDSADPTKQIHHIFMAYNLYTRGVDSAPDCYGACHDITYAYNVWIDNQHPISWSAANTTDERRRFTEYGNVFIRTFERGPQLKNNMRQVHIANNISYGWGTFAGGAYPRGEGAYGIRFQDDAGVDTNPQEILMEGNAFIPAGSNNADADCIFGDTSNPDGGGAGSARLQGPMKFVDNLWSPQHKTTECVNRLPAGRQHFRPPYNLLVLSSRALDPIFDKAGPPNKRPDEQALIDQVRQAYRDLVTLH